ncbi:MAG TPA: hypothetical protein VES88_14985 [Gemmatimonadaceae bacterium]|nr:hypothetical protein [Gemmatimonadaceae bacterium]
MLSLADFVENGIVVRPLPFEDFVSVEPNGLRLEVPFAEERGLVSRRLHQPRKGDGGGMQRFGVGHHTVQMSVLAGEHGRARRPADGIRDEGVDEQHPGACEAVEVRCARKVRAVFQVGRDRMRGVVVGHEENDIRPRLRSCGVENTEQHAYHYDTTAAPWYQ